MMETAATSLKCKGPETLENLKFRAEVDWIKVFITLTSTSQFRHVKSRLEPTCGNVFVEPVDYTGGMKYVVTIHDPKGPDQLLQMLQPAVVPGDPALTEDRIEICGIELAIDAYHRLNDRETLAAAALHFFVHHAHPPVGPPRMTAPGSINVPSTKRDVLLHLRKGYTVHGGPKEATYRSHFYVKTTDSVDGTRYSALAPEQFRARFELTWYGPATPFKTLAEWRCFRFEQLATSFAMVSPTATSEFGVLIQNRQTQLGQAPDAPKCRKSDRRKSSRSTCRDSITNDKIRQALRALTKRQCCQNSVEILTPISFAPLGDEDIEQAGLKYLNSINIFPQQESVNAPITSINTTQAEKLQEVKANTSGLGFFQPLPPRSDFQLRRSL